MSMLGLILSQRESSYLEVEHILRETFQSQKTVLGSEHPKTIRTMNHLAKLLQQQGKYDDAEEINHQISEVKKALDDSPNMKSSVEETSLPDQSENLRKRKR